MKRPQSTTDETPQTLHEASAANDGQNPRGRIVMRPYEMIQFSNP